jgi:hypothetical protein
MIDHLRRCVSQLNEKESKSLLMILFKEIATADQTKEAQATLLNELRRIYEEFTDLEPEEPLNDKNLSQVHIVCGESAAGSLKVGLSSLNAKRGKVIALSADLSIGPLGKLDEKEGMRSRIEWISRNFVEDNEEEEHPISVSVAAIRAIHENVPITICASDNAWEQTALSFIVYLLKGRSNELRVINPCAYFKKRFEEEGGGVIYSHTGEMASDILKSLFKKYAHQAPLSDSERSGLEEEWVRLSQSDSQLRIWKDDHVQTVSDHYFDREIIKAAKHLSRQADCKSGMLCVRLIGEVIGQVREYQWVSDVFIEYRIRALIRSGKFVIKTVPERIRFAQIKLTKG